MRITELQIRNFRGIRSLNLQLGPVTVLIGENNSGKTSVLDALKLCLRDLGPRRHTVFDAMDFHLPNRSAEPSTAEPIQIEVTFSDATGEEWPDELVGALNRARILQVDDNGRHHVRLRVTCKYDQATRDFVQDWSFLDIKGEALQRPRGNPLRTLQDGVRYFYLTALRDAARHFDAKGPFWKPFLQDSQLSPDEKAEVERRLEEVNDLVVSSHTSFEKVRAGLKHVQSVVPLATDEAVSIEAVPGRTSDMLARARVQLGTTTGAKIPLGRHGEGTQSLAVLMLFSAFLQAQTEGSTVLALEEPEAHLHPSAIRSLWQLMLGFTGQKLISTHSGQLLAETDINDVRRLARTPRGIKAFQVTPGLLTKEETRKFNYHVQWAHGDLLFARCWLLVEGQTEIWVYPAAARTLDLNLHREGIRVVDFSQSDVGMLTKVANALGIAWYCVGDDDSNRIKVEPKLKQNLDGAHEADRFVFPYPDIERNLRSNGYEDIYKRLPRRAKTKAAAEVATTMEDRGKTGVTAEIRAVLQKTVSLARGSCQ